MAVPFGFSIGDLIAVGNILKEAASALKRSGGAADSYQDVIQQLRVWSSVLEEIHQLTPASGDVFDVNAIKGQAQALQNSVELFLGRVSKFEEYLGRHPKTSIGRAAVSKIQWATRLVKEVDTFRTSMSHQISCLSLLIQVVSQKQHRRKQAEYETLGKKITALQSSLNAELSVKFEQEIATNGSLIISQIISSEGRLLRGIQDLFKEQQTRNSKPAGKASIKTQDPNTGFNVCSAGSSLSPKLCTILKYFLDYALEIVGILWISLIRLIVRLWPEILVLLRQTFTLSRKLRLHQISDCIHFEDVLGCIHYLPIKYYNNWNVLVSTLEASLIDLSARPKLMERIRAGKFRILENSTGLVTASEWSSVVKKGARMSMSVEMDALTAEEQLLSGSGCLREECKGRLILGNHDAYRCEGCSRSYLRGRVIASTNPMRDSSGHCARSQAQEMSLEDTLCQSNNVMVEKYIHSEGPFMPKHKYFQDFRRQASEDFIKHCDLRIRQFESVKKKLHSLQNTINQIHDSTIQTHVSSLYSSSQDTVMTATTKTTEQGLVQNRHRVTKYLHQIPSPPSLYSNYLALHQKAARDKEDRRRLAQKSELEEADEYKRLYLPLDPEAPERDFINTIASNDVARISSVLEGHAKIASFKTVPALQMTTIDKQGDVVDLLLELGLNPLAKAVNDESALMTAVNGGDASTLLSMLVAVNFFWTDYMRTESIGVKTVAEGITAALKSAVTKGNHLLVELFLFFGADPFLPTDEEFGRDSESAFDVATRCGMEDIIASFLTEAVEGQQTMSLPEAFNIVTSINTARRTTQVKLPSNLGSECQFSRVLPQVNTGPMKTILQWLQTDYGSFGSVFMGLPVTQSAGLAQERYDSAAGVKCGLVEPLKRMRFYFQHHKVARTAAIDLITKFFDRAIESVDELLDTDGADINIIDTLMITWVKEGADNAPSGYIESLWRLLVSADSDFPLVTTPKLDKTSYWRLQIDGFILIMKMLTDLKRHLRQLNEELKPLWRKLRKARRSRGSSTVQVTHTVKKSVLLPPQASYSINVNVLHISESQSVVSNAIDVSVIYKERTSNPASTLCANKDFPPLNGLHRMFKTS